MNKIERNKCYLEFHLILRFLLSFLMLGINVTCPLLAQEAGAIDYYREAVKDFLRDDLDQALINAQRHLQAYPDDAKAISLNSLLISKKDKAANNSASETALKPDQVAVMPQADTYFEQAFKKYLAGNLAEAAEYLRQALIIDPGFTKAQRFLRVIEERQKGVLTDDVEFVQQLLAQPQPAPLLPKELAQERISVDFKDEQVGNILRVLSQLYKVNIITGRDIDARITVSLVDVTLQEALDSILSVVNYSYIKDGGIIRVVDRNNTVLSKTYKLSNISLVHDQLSSDTTQPTEDPLIDKLKDVLSETGTLFYDPTLRTLMVTDTMAKLDMVSGLITDIDVFRPQILIEVKIVELSPSYNEDIGINWSVLEGYTAAVESPQVAYEHGEDHSSKPSWDWLDTDADTGDTFEHKTKLESAVTWTLKKTLTGTLSADNFQLVLSALKNDTDAKTVSSPNVLTKGGKEAYITIGEQYPIPNYSYNESQGTFEVTDFDYKDIGVILRVIPYPIADDYVSLVVTPEISQEDGSVTFGGAGGASIPKISTTRVRTEASIKSGHTMAIGGLIKEYKKLVVKKIPLLGDLPFLSKAFRHESSTLEKKNVIIFVTPTIITKDNMDSITELQSKKTLPEAEIEPPSTEAKQPAKWGRQYKRKKINLEKERR